MRLNAALARAVRDYVDNKSTGYASIDEFAEVALQNQLKLEGYVEAPRQPAEAATTGLVIEAGLPSLLLEPPETPPAEFGEPEAPTNDELFVLTNRLGPIKVAVRVLAQLQVEGAPAVA